MNNDNFLGFISAMTLMVLACIITIIWLLLHYEQASLIGEIVRLGIAFFGGGGIGAMLMRFIISRSE